MRRRTAFALLLAVSFGLYANTIGNEFVFDDNSTFRRNLDLRSLDRLPELLLDYRPVRYVSFAIDYQISGDDPWAYHVSNIVYHAITAYLVWLVLRRLVADGPAALAGALVFAAHPVHTESVAYISGRRDILTTLFFLLAFLAWLAFRGRADERVRAFGGDGPEVRRGGRKRWLVLAAGAWALAMGAKEMAITLPAVCALHDVLGDPGGARRRLPVYGLGILVAAGAAIYIMYSGASVQRGWHGGSASANFGTSARLVVHYAQLMVFPLRLLGDYSYEAFPLSRSLLDPRALLSLVAIAAAGVAAVKLRRRAPLVSFGIGWFVGTLVPVLHIIPFHELAAEHYLYLPSVGFCLLAALAFRALRARAPRAALAGLAVVLLLFGARTVVRNRDWKDSETFWTVTAETAPRCARAQLNVATVHAQRQEWEAALAGFGRAVEIRPDYVLARVQLGKVLKQLGREEEARTQWEEALRLAYAADARTVNPADVCVLLGRYEEAIDLYEDQIRREVRTKDAYRGLIICHRMAGRHAEALKVCDRLLALEPTNIALLEEAARHADKAGEGRRAAELWLRARRLRAAER